MERTQRGVRQADSSRLLQRFPCKYVTKSEARVVKLLIVGRLFTAWPHKSNAENKNEGKK
jgi:hypothetical protein